MTEQISEEISEVTTEQKNPFWGPAPTFGFGCALISVAVAVAAMIGIVFVAVKLAGGGSSAGIVELFKEIETNGLYFSISTIISASLCTFLMAVFIKLRQTISVAEYLGLRRVSTTNILISLAITLGFMIIVDVGAYLLDKPLVTQWQLTLYGSSGWPALMWIAFVVFGPIFEEALFRGFLLEGFRQSRIGVVGAIILTTLLWSLSHIQYSFSGMAQIFVFGILLGIMRFRTGSLWSVISMHALFNLVGMIEMALYSSGLLG